MGKLVLIVTEIVLKVRKVGGPLAKELALRLGDTALDVFEEYAARTHTPIDDSLLRLVRAKLGVPEFDDVDPASVPDPGMDALGGGEGRGGRLADGSGDGDA